MFFIELFNDKGKLVQRPGRKAIGPVLMIFGGNVKWQPATEGKVFYEKNIYDILNSIINFF
jgi:hypothetical protein